MTKQEILDYFSLIDFAYNESGRLESLSRMLDELLKEQEHKDKMYHALEEDWKRLKELLKKQEAQKFFVDESGKITPLPVVVRCKDCKHRNNSLLCPVALLAETVMKTRVFDFKVSDDWYCADGERSE